MEIDREHRLTAVEDRSKANTRRIEDLEKRQDNLAKLVSTVEVLAVREQNVENDVKEIKTDVKSLTNKPAERWNGVVDKVIYAVVAAVVGFLLARLGM